MTCSDIYYRLADSFTGWEIQTPVISLLKFNVFKITAKGVWIKPVWDYDGSFKKFVLDGKGRRFAYPTFEEARESYILRKRHHIEHLVRQLDNAKSRLAIANRLTEQMTENVKRQIDPPSLGRSLRPLYNNPIVPKTWTRDAS